MIGQSISEIVLLFALLFGPGDGCAGLRNGEGYFDPETGIYHQCTVVAPPASDHGVPLRIVPQPTPKPKPQYGVAEPTYVGTITYKYACLRSTLKPINSTCMVTIRDSLKGSWSVYVDASTYWRMNIGSYVGLCRTWFGFYTSIGCPAYRRDYSWGNTG